MFVDLQHQAVGSKLSTSFHLLAFPLKAKHEVSKPVPGITGAICASISVSNDILELLENPACGRSLSHAKPTGVTVVQKQSEKFRIVKVAPLTCKDNLIPAHSPSPEDTEFPNTAQELKKMPCSFSVFWLYKQKGGRVITTRPSAGRSQSIRPQGQIAVGLTQVKDTQRCLKCYGMDLLKDLLRQVIQVPMFRVLLMDLL